MQNITIIGTGYVGLVSGSGISDFGHQVTCADIVSEKIDQLNKGVIPIYEPGLDEIVARNVKAGRLKFTSDVAAAIRQAAVIFIAVGTPENGNGSADLTAVFAVARTIAENLNGYKVICTKSTVPVGTGDRIVAAIRQHAAPGSEFDYVSNPEFLREGAAVNDFLRPNRIVIGATSERAFEILRDVYRPLYINETPMIHTTVRNAEMIKYASNAFLALKISYINEVANLCEKAGADIHVVTKAMGSDGRISPKFLHPGPGFGGSCFPKDTQALVYLADELDLPLHTIQAAITANRGQKQRMVEKFLKLLGPDTAGRTVTVLGLSFKPNTDDVRESPAMAMLKGLTIAGFRIKAYDPIANANMKVFYPGVEYCENWEEAARDSNGVVIMTEWNEFRGLDLVRLGSLMKARVLLDTRNILGIDDLIEHDFKYDTVGRGSSER